MSGLVSETGNFMKREGGNNKEGSGDMGKGEREEG